MKKPEIRYLSDLKNVLYDQRWLKKAKNFGLYYIYRGTKEKNGLRYDITIIPPKMLGREFVKTKGHKHFGNYQEIYQVLKGKAIFLLQKGKGNLIEDVYAIKAKKEEVAIIPAGYSHLTINPSRKILKLGNWISEKCKQDYKSIERKRGGCYYCTKNGWLKNKNYKRVPKLRFEKPLKSLPKNLAFLKS